MKSKIAMSLLVIVVALTMIVGSTVAYFGDIGNVSGNTFSSGTLIMKINGLDNAPAAWRSDSNWAPGQSVSGTLQFQNVGTVAANHIFYTFNEFGDTTFMDNIHVTALDEIFDGVSTGDQVAAAAAQVGDGQLPLTLRELTSVDWYAFDNVAGGDPSVINGSTTASDYSLSFTFTFNPDAGDTLQGKIAGFDLVCRASQETPTDGYLPLQ